MGQYIELNIITALPFLHDEEPLGRLDSRFWKFLMLVFSPDFYFAHSSPSLKGRLLMSCQYASAERRINHRIAVALGSSAGALIVDDIEAGSDLASRSTSRKPVLMIPSNLQEAYV